MKKVDNNIILNDFFEKIIKIFICFSSPFLTILLSNRFDEKEILVGAILSFIITSIFVYKKLEIKKINIKYLIVSIIIGFYSINNFMLFSYSNIELIKKIINFILKDLTFLSDTINIFIGIMSVPFVIFISYSYILFIKKLYTKFMEKLSNSEKKYLKVMLIVGIILSVVITSYTSLFAKPIYNGAVQNYDVLYTSDNGALVSQDTYTNVSYGENDIRQPLFGIVSLPVAIPAKMISELCFFVDKDFSYPMVMTIVQFLLTTISTILIVKMMGVEEKNKKWIYLLFSCSFSYIVFNLIIEQYVIALFYLILSIYFYYENKDKVNYFYAASVGSLLTSGIIFPLISNIKKTKKWFSAVLKCFILFMATLIIGGQFPQLLGFKDNFYNLTHSFAGKVSAYDKICQFTNFVKGIFIAPSGAFKLFNGHPSYQLTEYTCVSIIGVIILLLVFISFILNRKNKFAKLSILWVLFSIVILYIIGWGTVENGLILYSLYFSWAYIVLIYMLVRKLLKNDNAFKVVIVCLICIISIFSISEFIKILEFGLKYYRL